MRAPEFYEHFESGFAAASSQVRLRRLKSPQPKWTTQAADGTVTFKFSTNSKAAGLLPLLWPGEFRPLIEWRHATPKGKVEESLSFFQYTSQVQVDEAIALQRAAIGKYLRGRYERKQDQDQWIATFDPFHAPVPNIEQWFYYFDSVDAASWGRYFGSYIGSWLHLFNQQPESLDSWCWRVLWKDLPRKS